MTDTRDVHFTVRSFRPSDQEACHVLYVAGLVGGSLAENDTALDLDEIATTYLEMPGSHFWIAENTQGEIVGMIGVQHHDEGKGEIRRLRVRGDHRNRGIGSELVRTALRFCIDQGYLQITLDTYMDRQTAIGLFEEHRFKLSRTRRLGERELLYFYFDLYERPKHGHD